MRHASFICVPYDLKPPQVWGINLIVRDVCVCMYVSNMCVCVGVCVCVYFRGGGYCQWVVCVCVCGCLGGKG